MLNANVASHYLALILTDRPLQSLGTLLGLACTPRLTRACQTLYNSARSRNASRNAETDPPVSARALSRQKQALSLRNSTSFLVRSSTHLTLQREEGLEQSSRFKAAKSHGNLAQHDGDSEEEDSKGRSVGGTRRLPVRSEQKGDHVTKQHRKVFFYTGEGEGFEEMRR